MIEQIYPVLILIGATIGAVLLYFWHQARRTNNISLALIRLNEQLHFDTPIFLENAWPLLSQAGIKGLSWRLDWFGMPVVGQAGQIKGEAIRKEIQVAEMKLAITFQQNRKSEQRYFDESLIETFLLLVRTDMWIKAAATDATFAQMAKLTMFLQHDMKNVAQFIQLMADQLTNVPEGKEQRVMDYLRTAAPLIRHRADRIVHTLTLGKVTGEPLRLIDLQQELKQICSLYRLECTIDGMAHVRVPENTLDTALDNILKNYSDISARNAGVKPLISAVITELHDAIEIKIEASNMPPVTHANRLFEPFWSNDPAGLGIGLYQAKQMLEICSGTVTANLTESGQLQFSVHIPSNPESI